MAYKDKSNAIKYNNEYNSKAYDRVNLTIPKGEKDLIRIAANQAGQSVNAYILDAIHQRMEKEQYDQAEVVLVNEEGGEQSK